MPTPPNVPRTTEVTVEDTAATADTAVVPPGAPAPPPPVAEPYPVPDGLAAPPAFPASEHVIVDDANGTRVVQRDIRPTLPPEEDPRRWNWLTPTLIAICLIALGIVLAAIVLARDDDEGTRSGSATTTVAQTNAAPANVTVQVPTVVGQNRGQAEAALENAGFAVVVVQVPGRQPVGQVLAQSPRAGVSATEGDTIRINVSDGAQSAATAAPATSTPATSTPATSVPETPATTPTTGSTTTPATGSSDTSTTSDGTSGSGSSSTTSEPAQSTPAQPTSVSVPSASGDVKAAVQQLNGKGLLASIQYVPNNQPLGTVVAQSPSDGQSAQTGSHVTLSIASGPGEKEQMSVPDTSGQTIPQAVETLNGSNLRLIMVKKTVTDREQAGKVVEQTPQPGAKAPKNAQVLVYMGAFKG